jgi:hypothetical protein
MVVYTEGQTDIDGELHRPLNFYDVEVDPDFVTEAEAEHKLVADL